MANKNQNKKQQQEKRRTTRSTSIWDVVKFCAYIAMAVAAVVSILSFVFGIIRACGVDAPYAGRLIGVCNTIAQVSLIVAVVIPAYHYMRSKSTVVQAFFWVAVIFLILGLVGFNLAF